MSDTNNNALLLLKLFKRIIRGIGALFSCCPKQHDYFESNHQRLETEMDQNFHLQEHLNKLYAGQSRTHGWHGGTAEEFKSWQKDARQSLISLLRIESASPQSHRGAECLGEKAKNGYTEYHWRIPGRGEININAYTLRPTTPGPHQPVLVFHGHNPSVQYCLGHYPDEDTEKRIVAKQGDYARVLAQAGYLVIAVEQRGFGVRQSGGHHQRPEVANTDHHIALFYQLLGKTLIGERVDDGRAILDWLENQPDVDLSRLALTGQSGGGTTSIYLAAIDERPQIIIPSCGMSSMRASLLAEDFSHCLCNYIPGILTEFESGDIACCIAPRPLRLIQGQEDRIFPIQAVREQAKIIQSAYEELGKGKAFDLFIHPDGHRFDHQGARTWIEQWREQSYIT